MSFLPGPLARPLPHLNYSSLVPRCSCDHLSGGLNSGRDGRRPEDPSREGRPCPESTRGWGGGWGESQPGRLFPAQCGVSSLLRARRLLPAWALGSGHPPGTARVLLPWNRQRSIGRWRTSSHRAWRDSAFRLPGGRMGWGQFFLVGIWV